LKINVNYALKTRLKDY